MTISARDRHARLGQPELRADNVDNSLPFTVQIPERDTVLCAIAFKRREHLLG